MTGGPKAIGLCHTSVSTRQMSSEQWAEGTYYLPAQHSADSDRGLINTSPRMEENSENKSRKRLELRRREQ